MASGKSGICRSVDLCLCVDSQKLQLLTTSEITTPITLRSVVTEKHGLKMEIPDSQWLEESRPSRQGGERNFVELRRNVRIPAYYIFVYTLFLSSLLTHSRMERCRTDDLMPKR